MSSAGKKRYLGRRARMSRVPTDLIPEILIRLEAETLVRFRGVCKSWKEIIKSPAFIKDHLTRVAASRSLRSRRIIAQTASCYFTPLSVEFSSGKDPEKAELKKLKHPAWDATRYLNVVGSCNGIVCLEEEESGGTFILWNPSTGIFRKFDDKSDYTRTFGCSHCYFCYSAAKDEYYVLRVSTFALEVYNLNKHSWTTHCLDSGVVYIRKGVNSGPLFIEKKERSGVVFHDALYLVVGRYPQFILSFDLSTNSFDRLELPRPLSNHENLLILGELQGSLCVFGEHPRGLRYGVWVMNADGDGKYSWRNISFKGSRGLVQVIHPLPYTTVEEDDDDGTQQVVGFFRGPAIKWCDFKNKRATPFLLEGNRPIYSDDIHNPCVCLRTLASPFLL